MHVTDGNASGCPATLLYARTHAICFVSLEWASTHMIRGGARKKLRGVPLVFLLYFRVIFHSYGCLSLHLRGSYMVKIDKQ